MNNQVNPIIRLLTPVQDSDVLQLMEIFIDEETRMFIPELTEDIREEEDVRNFLNNIKISQSTGEVILWGIRQDSTLIGFIGIMDIPEYPTLFYAMHPNHRGKGIMKESVSEAIGWFHTNHPVLPLHTEVYKGNKPSIHLLQQNDFTQFNEDKQKIFLRVEPIVEQSV